MRRRATAVSFVSMVLLLAGCAVQDADDGNTENEPVASRSDALSLSLSTVGLIYRADFAFAYGYGVCGALNGSWSSEYPGRCFTRGEWIGVNYSFTYSTCANAGGVWASAVSRCYFRQSRAPAGTYQASVIHSARATQALTGAVCTDYWICRSLGGTVGSYDSYNRCNWCSHTGTFFSLSGTSAEYGDCQAMGGLWASNNKCWSKDVKIDIAYMYNSEYGNCSAVGGSWGEPATSTSRRCWHRHL